MIKIIFDPQYFHLEVYKTNFLRTLKLGSYPKKRIFSRAPNRLGSFFKSFGASRMNTHFHLDLLSPSIQKAYYNYKQHQQF